MNMHSPATATSGIFFTEKLTHYEILITKWAKTKAAGCLQYLGLEKSNIYNIQKTQRSYGMKGQYLVQFLINIST